MKSKEEDKSAEKSKRSYQSTMKYLNLKLEKYDTTHENFVVPWQMVETKKKEFSF